MNKNTIDQEEIDDIYDASGITQTKAGEKTGVVCLTLPNGFQIVETYTFADPQDYNPETALQMCEGRLKQKIAMLESYRLQDKLHNEQEEEESRENDTLTFWEKWDFAVESAGLTDSKLVSYMGCSSTGALDYLDKRVKPSKDHLDKLATELKLDPSYFDDPLKDTRPNKVPGSTQKFWKKWDYIVESNQLNAYSLCSLMGCDLQTAVSYFTCQEKPSARHLRQLETKLFMDPDYFDK